MAGSKITVRKELYVAAPDRNTCDRRTQAYTGSSGLRRVERRDLQREADWSNDSFVRYSEDNGRTWGDWQRTHDLYNEIKGEDEISLYHGTESYNPKFGHFVSLNMRRIFIGGHKHAYELLWGKGEASFFDHTYVGVRHEGSEERALELVKYENGAIYNPDDWRNPAHLHNNNGYEGCGVDVQENGDIIGTVAASIRSCCRMRGLDLAEVFPSCPDIMCGLIVFRGIFNPGRGHYDLIFSRSIVISDLKSSRGVCEPAAITLPSGRILAVFRGSNVISSAWNTRIEPGTPAHKWFCWSDDGGRTFTDPVPWHFDNGEVFYSPATISRLFRHERNGKLYWIGNITDHTAYGNGPRYPLQIVEINGRGLPIRESLTLIDERGGNDAPTLQLSNFSILHDRETGLIELDLSRLGERADSTWNADSYRYFIDVGG